MDYYYDYYDFGDSFYNYDTLGTFIGIIIVICLCIMIFACVFAIIAYIFKGISLYTLAKKRNLRYPWIAWIPMANRYLLGALINDQVSIGSLHIPYAAIILPLLSGVSTLLSNTVTLIPFVGWIFLFIAGILIAIYEYSAYYWLYRIYNPKNATLYLVLSIIFPVTIPFFWFSLRDKAPDYTDIPRTTPCAQNPRAVLSFCLGILSMLSSLTCGGFWVGVCAIIFGILSYQELKKENAPTLFAILGIIFGALGIIMIFLLPVIGLAVFQGHSLINRITNSLYINTTHYPFL